MTRAEDNARADDAQLARVPTPTPIGVLTARVTIAQALARSVENDAPALGAGLEG